MLSKFEIGGIGLSILFMALALYLVRVETTLLTGQAQENQLAQTQQSGVISINSTEGVTPERGRALLDASDSGGNIKNLIIDDIVIGTGEPVVEGDTVTVHYIGTIRNGREFDNSRKRGEPFTFTVGESNVIEGWHKGLVGMKTGGQRILVVPSMLAYGEQTVGPIPPNSTLVFAVELLEIK